ncbi:non-ribosomal peptide synthetase [Pseudoalteromonas sp. MMG013]|uniref:non-ribosomal peptide synthetase n=1 Tax=Pseudoalteromonas sp. MMG013 TaxID=2822687 RepID=UPI001B390B1F|nr:non-ribosomal peptide synthetase [Pseudoalteromonas sp. MMG013]MBQ4862191.1 non-ribosomal peptide synthetase [Pseudoalteromonas sp. MMG013]
MSNVCDLFNKSVEQAPEQVCLVYQGRNYRYSEIAAWSSDIASSISAANIDRGQVIAVIMDRSPEMVSCIWGVLKAGCVYLPIEPSLPLDRQQYMIQNAGCNYILAQHEYRSSYQTGFNVAQIDEQKVVLLQRIAKLAKVHNPDCDLAYIMYTSGTTGKPKGVMIDNSALYNYVIGMQDVHPITFGSSVLLKTPFNFDVSIRELIWTLCYGASLIIAEPEGHKDPVYISYVLAKYQINIVHFVPSMLQVYLQHEGTGFSKSVECVICSGEALQINHVERFYQCVPDTRLLNMYGPTEATVEVTSFDCKNLTDHRSVPIGQPIGNVAIHILDDSLKACEVEQAGDLYISGNSLSVGYLGNQEQTGEKFFSLMCDNGEQTILYKTGDIARYLQDGNIEYLGRQDEQVNIRGYRIELTEVQSVINSHKDVDDSVIALNIQHDSHEQIAAYVKVKYDAKVSEDELLTFLKAYLPDYMVPSSMTFLDDFPLTENGKVDKKALPKPVIRFSAHILKAHSKTQKTLEELWQNNLNIARELSLNDNYMNLGGDSISLIYLIKEINKAFNIDLLFQDIVSAGSLAAHSELVDLKLSNPIESDKPSNDTGTEVVYI